MYGDDVRNETRNSSRYHEQKRNHNKRSVVTTVVVRVVASAPRALFCCIALQCHLAFIQTHAGGGLVVAVAFVINCRRWLMPVVVSAKNNT